jgi:hypothetical protein
MPPRFVGADDNSEQQTLRLVRPAPAGQPEYREAEVVGDHVVHAWTTPHGAVGVAHSLVSGNGTPRFLINDLYRQYGEDMHRRYDTVVVAQAGFDVRGVAALAAVDIHADARTSSPYKLGWARLAQVLGTNAPFWPAELRHREAMLAWRPDQAPAIVPPVEPELPTGPLLTLAALEPDDSPAGQVCRWLARTLHYRAAEAIGFELRHLADEGALTAEGMALAALPLPFDAEPGELSELTRRAGWLQIAERHDQLAREIAILATKWDNRREWPTGAVVLLTPTNCPTTTEWTTGLVAWPADVEPPVLARLLLDNTDGAHTAILLHDPASGMPAVQTLNYNGDVEIRTPTPARLPTTEPLAALILSNHTAWIRTQDGQLWLAPPNTPTAASNGATAEADRSRSPDSWTPCSTTSPPPQPKTSTTPTLAC